MAENGRKPVSVSSSTIRNWLQIMSCSRIERDTGIVLTTTADEAFDLRQPRQKWVLLFSAGWCISVEYTIEKRVSSSTDVDVILPS